jgi:LCP family protein required for cell wall assembly
VGVAAGLWLLISVIAFAASSWLQSTKLADDADAALGGGGFALASPQTILVIGTDARRPDTKEPGAAPSQECFDQQSRGEAPEGDCSEGQFRADTLLLVRAGGAVFRKLSIPRDSFAEVPGQTAQKINGAYAFGGAALQIETIEGFLGIELDHVMIIDFEGFEEFIDAIGGVEVDVPQKLCAEISGGAGGGQGGITLRIGSGEQTLDGQKALAYARVRKTSPCPGPGKSAFTAGYNDLDRARAQQAVLNGIKGRLTSIWRIPYNFIKGPIIGWEAPQALVSDMGPFTLSQLALSSAVTSSGKTDVLCAGANSGCGPGPAGSIEVPDSERRRAVDKLLNG